MTYDQPLTGIEHIDEQIELIRTLIEVYNDLTRHTLPPLTLRREELKKEMVLLERKIDPILDQVVRINHSCQDAIKWVKQEIARNELGFIRHTGTPSPYTQSWADSNNKRTRRN